MELPDDSAPIDTSADAMHYSAAAAGAKIGKSAPDPVAHLAPAVAARVLAAAERIDPDALLDAIEGDGRAEV